MVVEARRLRLNLISLESLQQRDEAGCLGLPLAVLVDGHANLVIGGLVDTEERDIALRRLGVRCDVTTPFTQPRVEIEDLRVLEFQICKVIPNHAPIGWVSTDPVIHLGHLVAVWQRRPNGVRPPTVRLDRLDVPGDQALVVDDTPVSGRRDAESLNLLCAQNRLCRRY